METQKLTFEPTPQIERYLEDILYLHDEWLVDNDSAFYLIEEGVGGEDSKQWGNAQLFWGYLKKYRAIQDLYGVDIEEIVDKSSTKKLIAVVRTHEENRDGGSPIRQFFARPDHWQEDLEKVARYTVEYRTSKGWEKPYIVLRVFKIEFIRELLRKITAKEKEKSAEIESNTKTDHRDSKVRFNPLTGVIRYGDEMVRFHRGERSNKPRLQLFRELWTVKKYIKKGKIKAKGESFPPETFAVRINMISSAGDFQRNKQAQERFFSLIKGINRELRNKEMPMEIERNNGIQLIITEK